MRNKILSVLFVLFTFFVGFNILVYNEGDKFSITENRELSRIEPLSISGWIIGSFQESVEDTLADHFIAREYFVKIHNNINITFDKLIKMVGKVALNLSFDDKFEVSMINEDISLLTINGEKRLVRNAKEYNQETNDFIKSKIELLNSYYNQNPEVEFYSYFVISPHHSSLIYPKNNSDVLIPFIEELEFPVSFFKITSLDDIQKYFFATDHHWNHVGSYKGYYEIAKLMLVEEKEILIPQDLIYFEEVEFWGSHSRSIAHSVDVEPDDIYKYIFNLPQNSLYINGKKEDNYGNLEDYMTKTIAEKDEKGFDHYNHLNQSRKAVIKIDTGRNDLDNLLVISDSMSNPIRELIASHFNESVFINIDIYNREVGKFNMNQYIKENEVDNVLIFLSIDNLFPNGDIKYLSD